MGETRQVVLGPLMERFLLLALAICITFDLFMMWMSWD
jgi:hypothetical protein